MLNEQPPGPSTDTESPTETNDKLDELLGDWKEVVVFVAKIFGIDLSDMSEEQEERVTMAATLATEGAQEGVFDANSHGLEFTGDPALDNPAVIPWDMPKDDIPQFSSSLHRNTWARRGDSLVWWDESGIYFDEQDIAFLIRDGFDGTKSVEDFLESRMQTITFCGSEIEVHPIFAARLQVAERLMQAQGIEYRPDTAGGHRHRSMNANNRVSNHALGLALDLNAGHNEMRDYGGLAAAQAHADFPPGFVEAMRAAGIRTFEEWSSNGRIDVMHFDLDPQREPRSAIGTLPMAWTDAEHRHE